MRPPAAGRPERHHKFIRPRSVGHRKLHGQIMRPPPGVVLVHQGHLHLGIGGTADIGEAKIGLGPHGLAVEIAEAQGVDQGRAMFHLAVGATDGGLAIGFDPVAATGQRDDHVGQKPAQKGRDADYVGLQILDIAAPGPGVGQDGGHGHHPQRRVGDAGAIAVDDFIKGHELAQFGEHRCLLQRVLARKAARGAITAAGSSIRAMWRKPGRITTVAPAISAAMARAMAGGLPWS